MPKKSPDLFAKTGFLLLRRAVAALCGAEAARMEHGEGGDQEARRHPSE
jgi:hypothetical protein